MNKHQNIVAKFMEKWASHLPSDAWMDIAKVMTELNDIENNHKNFIKSLQQNINDLEARLEEIKDSLPDFDFEEE